MVVGDGRLEADDTVGDTTYRPRAVVPNNARTVGLSQTETPPPGPTVRIQCENEEQEEVNCKQEQIATDSFELEFENW